MDIFEEIKKKRPVVHCITNKVTMNDCANILLAAKASPIMASDEAEVEEVTEKSSALCINIGTPDSNSLNAMIKAGKKANSLGIPVLLDPVGAGASQLRRNMVKSLLDEVDFSIIRGNLSEIKAIFTQKSGVIDVDEKDRTDAEHLEECIAFAKRVSELTGAVIVITGEIDVVSDGKKAYSVHNGHPMMRYVTGAGCMTSALTAAFMACADDPFEAAFYGVSSMGICGEIAYTRMTPLCGNASYRNYIIDGVFNLNREQFERMARYESR